MERSLVIWVTPFTSVKSLGDACGIAKEMAASVSGGAYVWTPRLLVPVHYGQWPQAQCTQSLPPDMLSASPSDVMKMRSFVNSKGLRFGVWGVPLNEDSISIAAQYAAAASYYVMNIEPGPAFWAPGDDPGAVDQWWGGYWNALPDANALNGRTFATVVPNQWGLSSFSNSLPNVAGGCSALLLEVYGGPNTSADYPPPNLWPADGFAETQATGVQATLVPILARANLHAQISQASGLGAGNVHCWSI